MLTKRTLLLTIPALLTSYLASAQTTATTGPTPASLLSLLAWGVAAVVLLFGVMTAASLAAVAADAVQHDATQNDTAAAEVPAASSMDATPATQQRIAA
ncbi:hypothetical protein [Hymenobacter lucidus]|uniref:Secreted protein n=1 Tax=Hymenobacter lucidus TaxID=2880930 RepID=A0ABS8AL99_9BACT|nr:hypothetical protein [Hymenobacter lucidus]MCB2406992.1 hypothetical protein [Hymenobacter lucidus]